MKIKIELPKYDISGKIKYFVDKFLTSGWGVVGRTKPSGTSCGRKGEKGLTEITCQSRMILL